MVAQCGEGNRGQHRSRALGNRKDGAESEGRNHLSPTSWDRESTFWFSKLWSRKCTVSSFSQPTVA